MNAPRTYSKKDIGRNVVFHGFDGKAYAAKIEYVRQRPMIVTLEYRLQNGGLCRAYVEKYDLNRIQGFDALHEC